MSDRINERNVPEIREVQELSNLDSSLFTKEMLAGKDMKRITTDVSVCIYIQKK